MQFLSSVRILAPVLLLTALLTAQPANRALVGTAKAPNGEPLQGVLVQLKDLQTLGIQSFITEKGGHYEFKGLSLMRDYELKAQFRGQWTSAKFVSHLTGGDPLVIDLTVR